MARHSVRLRKAEIIPQEFRETTDFDVSCNGCGKNIRLSDGNWLSCSVCDQSFHNFCIDPIPLDKHKGEWICPAHLIPDKDGSKNTEQITKEAQTGNGNEENYDSGPDEDDFNSMILFPYQIIPQPQENPSNRRTKRTPMKSIQPHKLKDIQTELQLAKITNQQRDNPILKSIMKENKEKLLSNYFEELKEVQEKLIPGALDMASVGNLNLSASNANATLQMMSGFSPLFLQFLAWQRLMQLQDEIGLMDNSMAPWVDLAPKKQKKKRKRPQASLEPAESPARKKHKPTNSSSTVQTNGKENQKGKQPIDLSSDNTQQKTVLPSPRRSRAGRRKQPSSSGISIKASTGKPLSSISSSFTKQNIPTAPALRSISPAVVKSTAAPIDTLSGKSTSVLAEARKTVSIPNPSVAKTKKKSSAIIDDETESITEVVTKPKGQSVIVEDGSTSKDVLEVDKPSKPVLLNSTEIQVVIKAEFIKKVVKKLGTVAELPLSIGRCDPRALKPKKLALNLQELSDDPSVKRVSHCHLEVVKKDNTLYLTCLGRNGIAIGETVLPRQQSVPFTDGMVVGVGPFALTILTVNK